MKEYTLAIIKPDAIKRNLSGKIISKLEEKGFKIVSIKMVKLSEEQAKQFYYVHKEKSFYNSLCKYMTSMPAIVMLLSKENAIEDLRAIMGATDPNKAEAGTIRKEYGLNIEQNSIHGSDSLESAKKEILFFFSLQELINLNMDEDEALYAIFR